MTKNLLDLPHEVLHSIIANADPQDLAALCCCRTLNDFIKNNQLLHKEIYLKTFVGDHQYMLCIYTEFGALHRMRSPKHKRRTPSGTPNCES